MDNKQDHDHSGKYDLRLKSLEERQKESHQYFKHTLTAVTAIFIFVVIIITVLSVVSKREISDAIKEMERRFELLSNQALLKPELEIYYNEKPVSGMTITIDNFIIPLDKFFIKNVGSKTAKDISITIYISEEIHFDFDLIEFATIRKSYIKGYESLLSLNENVSLNPDELWSSYRVLDLGGSIGPDVKSVSSKLFIYYGVDKPLELEIILNRAQKDK